MKYHVVRYALLRIYIEVIVPNPPYILGRDRKDAHDSMRTINLPKDVNKVALVVNM